MRLPLLLVSLVLLTGAVSARPAAAQFLDPDNRLHCWTCYGHDTHFLSGAAFDLAVRVTPFFAKSWRHSALGRVGTVMAVGAIYQLNNYYGICAPPENNWRCGVAGRGFSLMSLSYDLLGAGAVELVQRVVAKARGQNR